MRELRAEIAIVAGDLPLKENVFHFWPLTDVVNDQVMFYRQDMSGEVPMHWLRIIAFAILACLVLIAAVGFIYEQIGRARQAFVVRADRSALLCPWPQHESVLLGLGFTDRRLRNRRERPRLFLAGSAAQSGPVHTRLLVRPRRSRLERFSRHSSHQREHRG